MRDFNKELEQLRNKEINEFTITPEEFNDFYKAWENYGYQPQIIGKVEKLGNVKYILNHDHDN
ncbi:MAG: hypothetical protein LBC17_00750 [Lactobacillaceae bacterium]|nr:hypothetical protein [Lactobacillaceae bacterium]